MSVVELPTADSPFLMKTKWIVLTSLLAGLGGQSFAAETTAAAPADSRIEVAYVNPEKFTDFTDSS